MKMFYVLFVAVAVCLASSTITGVIGGEYTLEMHATDDVVYSNELTESDIYTYAYGAHNDFHIAEDFTPSANYDITAVTWWTASTTTAPDVSSMEVMFYADAAPGPGALLWSGTPNTAEFIDTGLTFVGFPIWMSVMTLPDTDYFAVNAGDTYWVSIHRTDGQNLYSLQDILIVDTECYRIDGIPGDPWVTGSSLGHFPTDVFQIIESTGTALDHVTWGSIKAVF